MKQILQHLRSGQIELAELPAPLATPGKVLIQSRASLISAGTESSLVEFSQANLISKARRQPDKVKQVLDKIKTDGLLPTLEAVFRKLDQPLPLGYCNAGVVLETGPGIHDLQPGDRIISNGPHAEIVAVPRNLCARIPDNVTDEQAAFTVLGSIALQGIRLAAPTLGERFMVFGMGLLGLLTVQLLRAHGCEVLAADINPARLDLARTFGAQTVNVTDADPIAAARAFTRNNGIDAVIITAAASSDDIVHQAAQACRHRGRIILVGVVGLNLRRSDFYEKEISFQVSCSYGPGRYDENYEKNGHDYPYGFVRWTEQRNFSAVLESLSTGRLRVDGLITNRYPFADAESAYKTIQNDNQALGVLLQYPKYVNRKTSITTFPQPITADKPVVAVIGAGNFSTGVLLPALARTNVQLACIADLDPAAARHAARKFSARQAVTDYRLALDDPDVNAVFIIVGHHLHSRFVSQALQAGKHVFVEKPLALNPDELNGVTDAVTKNPDRLLMVGFNRRFSPHIRKIKQLLAGRTEPLCMTMTVNAGPVPPDHWTQNPARGGGRIIGEGCHFIDLLSHLADAPVTTVSSAMIGSGPAVRDDKMSILLTFADGSLGTINYFANGSRRYPKETLEIFSDGCTLRLDNFRITRGYGFPGFKKLKTPRQDKGHRAEIVAFIESIKTGGDPPIPFVRLQNVTCASFAAVESARMKKTILLDKPSSIEPVIEQCDDQMCDMALLNVRENFVEDRQIKTTLVQTGTVG